MDREPFLADIAARLGRPRSKVTPAREYRSPAPFAAAPPAEEWAERFAAEMRLVGGEVVLASSADEARAALVNEIARAAGVVSWARSELFRATGLDLSDVWRSFGARCAEPHATDFRSSALAADVGITGVDAAVAQTGSLVIAADLGRPRAASLLPRLHVALVRRSQIVWRMGSGLSRFREGTPSAVHFVTGPSRTSDIENDLSIGVHGPARVLAIVLPEAP